MSESHGTTRLLYIDDDAGLRTFEGEPSGVVGRRRGVGGGHVHSDSVSH